MKNPAFRLVALAAYVSMLFMGASSFVHSSPLVESARPVIQPGHAAAAHADGAASVNAPDNKNSSPLIARIVEIISTPEAFIGREVRLTSRVREVYSDWTLLLAESPPLANGREPELLLVSREPLPMPLSRGQWQNATVKVTGIIRLLQADDFHRTYGRGLDDKLFRRYEGQPALIADSLVIAR